MACEMVIEIWTKNWVREVCPKCGRVVEYYGQIGTPARYVGRWGGRKPNSVHAGKPYCR